MTGLLITTEMEKLDRTFLGQVDQIKEQLHGLTQEILLLMVSQMWIKEEREKLMQVMLIIM